MDSKIARLPDAELDIMQIIWNANAQITSAYIMEKLKGKKNWSVTTVLNFLVRLADRGFVSCEKHGKINVYTPLISEEAYLESESKSFLEKLHGNSLKSLVASLYGGKAISQDDIDDLKRYIDSVRK